MTISSSRASMRQPRLLRRLHRPLRQRNTVQHGTVNHLRPPRPLIAARIFWRPTNVTMTPRKRSVASRLSRATSHATPAAGRVFATDVRAVERRATVLHGARRSIGPSTNLYAQLPRRPPRSCRPSRSTCNAYAFVHGPEAISVTLTASVQKHERKRMGRERGKMTDSRRNREMKGTNTSMRSCCMKKEDIKERNGK